MTRLAMLFLLIAAACAPMPAEPGDAVETIAYETAPCFGRCPIYRVEVDSDGAGRFFGNRFTAASGEHDFAVSPEQFAALAEHLAPYRPEGERRIVPGSAGCKNAPTDLPSVQVEWSGAGGSDRLDFYYGCGAQFGALSAALRSTPEMLPIGGLIGG